MPFGIKPMTVKNDPEESLEQAFRGTSKKLENLSGKLVKETAKNYAVLTLLEKAIKIAKETK